MELQTSAILGGAIIGLVNAVQMQFPEVKGFWGVLLAVALGVVAGLFGLFGANPETGLLTGLASSGAYKLVSKMGGQ